MSIKYAILGLLDRKPASGYELKKVFEDSTSMYWSGNNNQIYKALLQLQEDGFVTNETEHQEGSPSKKIYTITGEGVEELKSWISSAPEAPEFKKQFLIQLAFADILADNELFDMLTAYENEMRMQVVICQEKIRKGNEFQGRTEREKLLLEMIDENVLSSYKNELIWIEDLRRKLFENKMEEDRSKVDYRIIETDKARYIEVITAAKPINTEQDALDIIALCGEYDVRYVLLHEAAISEDFFRLKTGVAGRILQKFVNYCLKVSAVVPEEKINTGKFKEMARETNKGQSFRLFGEKAEAEKWLLGN